jgi:uncharacterized protein YraI
MRLVNSRAVAERGCAGMVAIALCLVSVFLEAQAQEMPVAGPSTIASAGAPVLLREHPGYEAAVLATLGDGNPLDIAGEPVTAADGTTWLPVVAGGQSGYVPTGYVLTNAATMEPGLVPAAAPASVPETAAPPVTADPVAAPSRGSPGATMTEANLRSGPGVDTAVLAVLPRARRCRLTARWKMGSCL